jgi:adenosine deaminase
VSEFIKAMPKAELHVHLEGTLEPELSFELARRNDIALPYKTREALLAAYDFHDLPSFLAIYYAGMSVLKHEQDFFALTWEYLLKAREQNIVYAELFFDPVIRGIHRAQVQAAAQLGVETQLIMCFLRDMSAESALQTLQQSLPYRDWLVGVGLDSDEKNNPPIKFAAVFAAARAQGLKLTMHCDVNQENTLRHIGQVLHDIRVDRIDHGVNSLEDMGLCAQIRDRRIGLTVCPISNRFVVQTLTAKEIRRMLELDMLATVNSDDPAYFRGYLNENLVALHEEGGLTTAEIVRLVRNSFEVSWIDSERRAALQARLDRYLEPAA